MIPVNVTGMQIKWMTFGQQTRRRRDVNVTAGGVSARKRMNTHATRCGNEGAMNRDIKIHKLIKTQRDTVKGLIPRVFMIRMRL